MDEEKCGRGPQWKKERMTYGFDERQTWNLNTTMIELLYERVKMYVDIDSVDLTHHTFTVDGVTRNQLEWVTELLEVCEEYLTENTAWGEEEYLALERRIWAIWGEISPAMWW